ncbi:hypothetical protein OG871_39765 (plasmid) [Kitasatospora sp. NBC_00374]|uniref:hypothetical protein n=1 Tax=Kitasatospora sp. NBC_00374 TaxID=2975964 RepID=UPI002F919A58
MLHHTERAVTQPDCVSHPDAHRGHRHLAGLSTVATPTAPARSLASAEVPR